MRRYLKLKAVALLALVLWAVGMVLPSVMPEDQLPTFVKDTFTSKFQLGLDLQGGLHLEYSVAVDEAIENKLDQLAAELEAGFRDKKDVDVTVTRTDTDTLRLQFPDGEDVDAIATPDVMAIASDLMDEVPPEGDEPGRDEGVVILKVPEAKLTELRKDAVSTALDTVRSRVDAMGVAEPNIYPKNRQLVIELPGLSDTSREVLAASKDAARGVADLMREAGADQIVTREVRGDPGAFTVTVADQDAEALVRQVFEGKIVDDTTISDDRITAELVFMEGTPEQQADAATVVLGLSEQARENVLADAGDFRRLLKIIERQAVLSMHLIDDETEFRDTGAPYLKALYRAGYVTKGMGIAVNILSDYGRENGAQVKEPYVYYAKERETLESFFNNLPAQWRLPSNLAIFVGPVTVKTRKPPAEPEILWRTYVMKSRAGVTGEHVLSASTGYDPQTGQPEVNVKLNRIGARLMEELSGENVGKRMGIVLDDAVRSDPVFNERIGASFRITLGATPGQSPREAANDLAKVLKSGSLPARLQKEFEIRVGADLGADSVNRGFKAFVIGLGCVILFMLIYYRGSGFIAVFALVLNMVLILAAMALFEATLTLPGIAGIVLTIGMAVDANVIVFERIREYIRDGYTARAAIESGYDRAFTTILDAQLTTAIAGLVLWQYGSGPIRGFAVTLLIGIATSIFTGVFCSRLFFDFQANRRGFEKVSI